MSVNIIKVNRGDSFELHLRITEKFDLDKKHLLLANEVVYFALLYPNQRFEDALILRGYTLEDQNPDTGEIKISITPSDTRRLAPGIYYYTVKLQRGGTFEIINDCDEPDEVRTLVERTKFILNE